MIRVHTAPGARVFTATLHDGRVYRVVVPEGSWKRFVATPEEWICGVAGVEMPRGMY